MKHEEATIRTFIVRRKRERYLAFVSNPGTRTKLIHALAHFTDIDQKFRHEIHPSRQKPVEIMRILTAMGSPPICHAISEDRSLDGRELPLAEALEKVVGSGMGTILSCIPGRLGFIETEDERFILKSLDKPARQPTRYIRFIATQIDSDSSVEEGVFIVAYRLRKDWEVPAYQREELHLNLRWLEEYLPVPEVLSRRGYGKAISWFKSGAKDSITRVWSIVHILEENGVVINKITTNRPGQIVYEDEWQIVARSFSP